MAEQTFEQWEARVNAIVEANFGMSLDDGIDWPARDEYEAGATPKEGFLAWKEYQGC